MNWVLTKQLSTGSAWDADSVFTSSRRLSDKKSKITTAIKNIAQQPGAFSSCSILLSRCTREEKNIPEKVQVKIFVFSMAQLDKILEGSFVDQEANLIKSQLIAKCRFLGSVRALQSPRTSIFFRFIKVCWVVFVLSKNRTPCFVVNKRWISGVPSIGIRWSDLSA